MTVITCTSDTRWSIALLLSTTLILSACDTSMTTGDAPQILSDPITLPTNTDSPVADLNGDTAVVVAAPTLTVAIDEYTLTFRWEPPVGSVTTRLLIHQPTTDSFDTLTTIEDNATRYTLKVAAHTLDWQTQYVLEHCDGNDCVRSLGTRLSNTESANTNPGSWLTSDNSKPYDALGSATALALNGRVLVAGAPGRDVVDSISNSFVSDAGAIHLYFSVDDQWTESAELTADQPIEDAGLGQAIAISFDGDTVAASTQENVLIFERFGEGYVQTAQFDLPASANNSADNRVSISREGNTVIASTPTAVNRFGEAGGLVSVYRRVDDQWLATDVLERSDAMASVAFGQSMALSASGDRVFISASSTAETNSATGVNGHVYLFDTVNGQLTPAGILSDTNASLAVTRETIHFAQTIATNDTGTTLLVSRTQAPASGSSSQLRSKSVSGIVVYEQTESSEWQVGHYLIPAGNHGAASLVQVSTNSDASVVSAALTDPVMALTDITTWIRTDAGYTFRSQLNNPDTEMNGFADNLVLSRNGERLAVGAPLRRDASQSSLRLFAGAVIIY